MRVSQCNLDLAEKLSEQARQNPASFAGKYVGIANGQVVVVTDDLDELDRKLRQADPEPSNRFFFEIGRDYSQVEYIWEMPCPAPAGR